MPAVYPWFVKRDIDGFFALLIDNLVQLLLIPVLCAAFCGMDGPQAFYVYRYILPGAAASILVGNLFYAWQAKRLAAVTGRNDITALPYGLNTPSLLVYILFVMAPVYAKTKDPRAAWEMGLFACMGSGMIELAGSFVAGWIRRQTPRAALLSTLAGISIGFISMTFALQIFQKPLITMLPLAVIFIALFAKSSFPWGLPGGLVAILAGTMTAWLLPSVYTGVSMSLASVHEAAAAFGWYPPQLNWYRVQRVLALPGSEWVGYLSVIIPMGLFNVVGSLQNIESAAAAGDEFDTTSSLAVNGLGTIVAALAGSCFPTTIYIGHPAWKQLGARSGYSILNGAVITLICCTGTVQLLSRIVPVETGYAIVLWVGVMITAQAFQTTPANHAPAVAIGLFPAIAAWGATIVGGAFILSGGKTMQDAITATLPARSADVSGFLLHGLLLMERGYIFTCMLLAALAASLVDRKFFVAAIWAGLAAVFTCCGLMHAYQLQGNTLDFLFRIPGVSTIGAAAPGALVYRATGVACGYAMISVAILAYGFYFRAYGHADAPAGQGH